MLFLVQVTCASCQAQFPVELTNLVDSVKTHRCTACFVLGALRITNSTISNAIQS